MSNNVPIYMEIYQDFHKKILEGLYKEGDMLPPETEICKQYLVSRITVQKALHKLTEKGLITRIPGKGTFVSGISATPNNKKISRIGLILCDFGVSYGVNLVRSIEKHLSRNEKALIIKNTYFDKDRESQAILDMLQQDVDGIILQPAHNEIFNPVIMRLSISKFPMVLIDRDLRGLDLPFVGTDNIASTINVMDYLFEQGHRHICFMSPSPDNTSTIEERLDGFQRAFIRHNFINHSSNIFTDIITPTIKPTPTSIREDIEKIKAHIKSNPQHTCIFAEEYSVCSLVKQALKELEKSIPDDMSLVSFDNINDPLFFTKTAYVRQNESEIGIRAVDLLLNSIDNKGNNTKIMLSGDFIKNASIKKIN